MIRGRRGFTLMEMTIMIAISAVLMTGMTRAIQTLLELSNDNRDYLIALNLARRQMAMINLAGYPAVVASETGLTPDGDFPSFTPTWQVTDVATSGGNSIRLIIVRVRRGSSTGPVLIRLDTYRSNIITFGNGV